MDKKAIVKLSILIAIIIVLALLIRVTGLRDYLSPERIHRYVESFGVWAPAIFLLIYTLRPLTLFPGTILTIASAFLFGIFWGTVYSTLGATIGAVFPFLIARKLGREAVARFISKKAKITLFDEKVAENGFIFIFVLRLVPVIIPSFDAVNIAAGLSKIRLRDFTFGTMLGLIPGTLFLVTISLTATNPSSPWFWGPLLCWCLFIAIALFYLNRRWKHLPMPKRS